jgi:hypothetical protein
MHSTALLLRAIALSGVFTTVSLSVMAQDDNPSDWNHFGLGFRMGFNIQARFMNAGFVAAPVAPAAPAAGGAVNRAYSDGFVNVDSSGNANGNGTGSPQTWNWGYLHSSQVVGDTLLMHAASGSSGAEDSCNNDPNLGFELSYIRDLGHETWGRWGIKAAFGLTDMDFSSSDTLSASAPFITDTYPLNGVTPPIAPYTGSFNGPGPVIGSTPTRSTTVETAIITGNRSLDATLYDFRLGPVVDLDLTKRLSIELGGGLALGVVDGTFVFNETTTTTSGVTSSSGSTSSVGCLVGAYAEAGLSFRVCSAASLFGAAQFQYLGTFNQSVSGRSVQLDLSQSVFCALGFKVHF